ncbi:hypothetical protein C8R45DRAFT_1086515 [Mycena sanguinolenta]|nr:hypothetical protein C8R45DRAFT_1086515 [Mycena sanguinolenta]
MLELSRPDDCVDPDPANTAAHRINTLLNSSGPGYVLQLYKHTTDDPRATLVVNGPVANGTGHTTAVVGACDDCSGITLRNVQINGARGNIPPTSGGATIEMGGGNANQTVQFVRSYDPRDWSCLHIAEGLLTCTNALVQNNDIGPCGVDTFQEWADGISMSCRDSVVRNNMINGATDGGIIVFGSPGTQVYNNTIWITNNTLLGGINKTTTRWAPMQLIIGIAISPRTWFGDRYLANDTFGGVVIDNQLSGAFGYGIAVSSARNFTIENNVLLGSASFIGATGANCSKIDHIPDPAPFLYDNTTSGVTFQTDFQLVADASSLNCIVPPVNASSDYWPFGSDPGSSDSSPHPSSSAAGVALGVLVGIAALGVVIWFIQKWALKRHRKLSSKENGKWHA